MNETYKYNVEQKSELLKNIHTEMPFIQSLKISKKTLEFWDTSYVVTLFKEKKRTINFSRVVTSRACITRGDGVVCKKFLDITMCTVHRHISSIFVVLKFNQIRCIGEKCLKQFPGAGSGGDNNFLKSWVTLL